MVCTDDEAYRTIKMLGSHGMVRKSDEASSNGLKVSALNPQFIFAHAAYNVRNTEIGAILGLSQRAFESK